MLNLSKVYKSFNDTLKQNFNCRVYGKETNKEYKMPCFSTELIVSPMEKLNKHIVKTEITINCAYLMETVDQVEQFKIIEKMRELFLNYLVVDDRTLHIKEFRQEYTGELNDILEFQIDIDVYDNTVNRDIDHPIEQVDLRLKRKETDEIYD